jgi:hypothetical protein
VIVRGIGPEAMDFLLAGVKRHNSGTVPPACGINARGEPAALRNKGTALCLCAAINRGDHHAPLTSNAP